MARLMKVGDIVKLIDKYAMESHKGVCGVITATVNPRCPGTVEVVFPMNTGDYRINMLEVVSAAG